MPLGVLQHYTIEPSNLERTRKFYCEVLGLKNGDRPPLGFPGYWLYSGGVPFAASDIAGVRRKLKAKKMKFREQVIPRTGGQQIFLYDPDGVGVELNFPPPEAKT